MINQNIRMIDFHNIMNAVKYSFCICRVITGNADMAINLNTINIIIVLFFYTLFRPPADQQPASANGPSPSKNATPPQSTSTNLTGQNQQTTGFGGGLKIGPLPPNLDELKVESMIITLNVITDPWESNELQSHPVILFTSCRWQS